MRQPITILFTLPIMATWCMHQHDPTATLSKKSQPQECVPVILQGQWPALLLSQTTLAAIGSPILEALANAWHTTDFKTRKPIKLDTVSSKDFFDLILFSLANKRRQSFSFAENKTTIRKLLLASYQLESKILSDALWKLLIENTCSTHCLEAFGNRENAVAHIAFQQKTIPNYTGTMRQHLQARAWAHTALTETVALPSQDDFVTAFAWSPDSLSLATGTATGQLTIWHLLTNRSLFSTNGDSGAIHTIAWSPTKDLVAVVTENGALHLYDIKEQQMIFCMDIPRDPSTAVAFSPDGAYIAFGFQSGTIFLVDGENIKMIKTLRRHTKEIKAIVWSPDGAWLATGSLDGSTNIWNTKALSLEASFDTGPVTAMAWQPDDSHIVVANRDKRTTMWNIAKKICTKTIDQHAYYVRSIDWLKDTHFFVTGEDDTLAKIWDAQSGTCVGELNQLDLHHHGRFEYMVSLAYESPDGQWLAATSPKNTVRIYAIGPTKQDDPTSLMLWLKVLMMRDNIPSKQVHNLMPIYNQLSPYLQTTIGFFCRQFDKADMPEVTDSRRSSNDE